MLAPVEVYASFSLIPGRSSCSNTACTALTVPDSVRVDPSARHSERTTLKISTSVVGRRRAQPAGPPVDGVVGAVVCPPAPVVCCQRRLAPCGRSRAAAPPPHQRHFQGSPEWAGSLPTASLGSSAARAPPPRPP
eukprot:scaffold43699_cov80-Phaeocystis_antarctica.AAC.2